MVTNTVWWIVNPNICAFAFSIAEMKEQSEITISANTGKKNGTYATKEVTVKRRRARSPLVF